MNITVNTTQNPQKTRKAMLFWILLSNTETEHEYHIRTKSSIWEGNPWAHPSNIYIPVSRYCQSIFWLDLLPSAELSARVLPASITLYDTLAEQQLCSTHYQPYDPYPPPAVRLVHDSLIKGARLAVFCSSSTEGHGQYQVWNTAAEG